ncbi:MerR family transcriptional regulator [Ferrovibrio sp.]|uniref:MerR family transcriptional regulator n=1 Tax=Ferrovibrio sp. TaxID=1917215 RepID=UPI0035AE2110
MAKLPKTETAADKPEKKAQGAFRTIGEVAEELGVAQHALRFWEKKFHHIRPVKRASGRRYYRVEDVELLREIRSLLHDQGYTIRGVQKLLREGGLAKAVKAKVQGKAVEIEAAPEAPAKPEKAGKPAKKPQPVDLRPVTDPRQVMMPFDILLDMNGLKQTLRSTLGALESLHAELSARQRR